MKQIDIHVKVNNPDGTNKEKSMSNNRQKNDKNVQVFTVLD